MSAPASTPSKPALPAGASKAPPITIKKAADPEINRLFRAQIKLNASDLHLQVGKPAILRIRGTLREVSEPPIDEETMYRMFYEIMDERNKVIFEENGGTDLAHVVPDADGHKWRFRVNLFKQLNQPGMVARKIEQNIPNFEGLYLPSSIEDMCKYDQGMVLLAGVTGSGKSTTIASMLDWVNHRERVHILTIEDPIEFEFKPDKALINQRELGMDVRDFHIAMKHAVREDPDIMLVGEMRDRDTFETAIHAAETGHLVFGTIHASSAPSTIGRILNLFPQDMHGAIRSSLAFNMRGILAQKLLPTIVDTPKRVPILEIMRFNPTVRKLVLEGQDEKLAAAMRIGKEEGMQQFNDSLYGFLKREFVSRETAYEVSPNVEELKMMLKGIDVKGPAIL